MSAALEKALRAYRVEQTALGLYLAEGDYERRRLLDELFLLASKAASAAFRDLSAEEFAAYKNALEPIDRECRAAAPASHPNAVAEVFAMAAVPA